MNATIDSILQRVSWMEWEEKLTLFRSMCDYIGEQAAYEQLLGSSGERAKETLKRRVEVLQFSDSWSVFEQMQLSRFLDHFSVDCVFDVGANEGQYAERLRSDMGYDGIIISFEPIPELAGNLRKKAESDSKWYVEELALDREEGTGSFNIMASSAFSSLLDPAHDDVSLFSESNKVSRRIEVTKSTLALQFRKYLDRMSFARPFLKLDTQGNDLFVIEGAGNALESFVGVQSELPIRKIYEGAPSYVDVLNVLKQKGFELSALFPNNAGHFPRLVEIDCIMYRRDLVEGDT